MHLAKISAWLLPAYLAEEENGRANRVCKGFEDMWGRDRLLEYGVSESCIYKDITCGRVDFRPGIDSCLEALQPGDTLVVEKLVRLSSNLPNLAVMVCDLWDRKADLEVLDRANSAGDELLSTSSCSVKSAILRFHDEGGEWWFDPSKVVGYEGMDYMAYEELLGYLDEQ